MNGNEDFARPASSRWRFRFSLLALLIFTTLVAILLAWLVQPNRVVATALFEVDSAPLNILTTTNDRSANDREFETLKNTQLALLRSNFVLSAAVRNPSVAALPILREKIPLPGSRTTWNRTFPKTPKSYQFAFTAPKSSRPT